MHRTACAFCVGLAAATFAAAPARADPVTYTFETQSSVAPGNFSVAQPLTLSFTVDGPVSFAANSRFADNSQGAPPVTQVAYQFPAALTAFSLYVPGAIETMTSPITLADFVSPATSGGFPGLPIWSFALTADPATDSASLSLQYFDPEGSFDFVGAPVGSGKPFTVSTSAAGTIDFDTEHYIGLEPAMYTGILTATGAVPEPGSAWLLLGALGMLGAGLACRAGGSRIWLRPSPPTAIAARARSRSCGSLSTASTSVPVPRPTCPRPPLRMACCRAF